MKTNMLFACALLLAAPSVFAQGIQRCVSPNGNTSYAEKCPEGFTAASPAPAAAKPSASEVGDAQARAKREQEAAKQAEERRKIEDAKRAKAAQAKPAKKAKNACKDPNSEACKQSKQKKKAKPKAKGDDNLRHTSRPKDVSVNGKKLPTGEAPKVDNKKPVKKSQN